MRVTMLDYGVGNLHSLGKALALNGATVAMESDPIRCLDTDVLLLPGVGAYAPAAARLTPAREQLRAAILGGLPTIGVCLGMQLFFAGSEEGPGEGLGILSGRVERLRSRRVPQIGWNHVESDDPLLQESGCSIAYYANSFVARPMDVCDVIAWTTHDTDRFPAVVRKGRTLGFQFHPEKSASAGVRLLALALRECAA